MEPNKIDLLSSTRQHLISFKKTICPLPSTQVWHSVPSTLAYRKLLAILVIFAYHTSIFSLKCPPQIVCYVSDLTSTGNSACNLPKEFTVYYQIRLTFWLQCQHWLILPLQLTKNHRLFSQAVTSVLAFSLQLFPLAFIYFILLVSVHYSNLSRFCHTLWKFFVISPFIFVGKTFHKISVHFSALALRI